MCSYVGIRSKVGGWSKCRTLMRGYWDFFDIQVLSDSVALNMKKLACAKGWDVWRRPRLMFAQL